MHARCHGNAITAAYRLTMRAPWTTVTVVIVLVVNLMSGALDAALPGAKIQRWGFGIDTFTHGDLRGIVTANYFVDHPAAILSTVVMIILFFGAIEILYGTTLSVLVWFVATWVATLGGALIWTPFAAWHLVVPVRVVAASEVGSSAATWCAMGIVLGLPQTWRGMRTLLGTGSLLLLLGDVVWRHSFTSVEHLVAFGSGCLVIPLVLQVRHTLTLPVTRVAARLLAVLGGLLALLTARLPGSHVLLPVLLGSGFVLILAPLVEQVPDALVFALLLGVGLLAVLNIPNIVTILVFGAAASMILFASRHAAPEVVVSAVRNGHDGAARDTKSDGLPVP